MLFGRYPGKKTQHMGFAGKGAPSRSNTPITELIITIYLKIKDWYSSMGLNKVEAEDPRNMCTFCASLLYCQKELGYFEIACFKGAKHFE